jgi:putative ABC transport system permease protein
MLVGASTRRLMVGFALEGLILGAIGGLIGLPIGHVAGAALVSQFGSALLEGTGATISTTFDISEVGLALGAGIAAALVAVLLAARSVVRTGILANLDGHVGGRSRSRSVAWWLVPIGIVLLVLAGVVLSWFGQGKLPFSSGQGGLSLAVVGTILITMAIAPRLARVLATGLARGNGVTGLMARAEIDRLPVRVGAAVTVLAIGLALAVTFSSLGDLGTSTTADRFAATTAGGVLVSPQQPWDQREGSLSDATVAAVRAAPGVTGVTERWRAIVSSPTVPRLVIAFDGPASAGAVAVTDGSLGAPGQPLSLGSDQVALSQVAAGRLGARPGDRIELPTLTGAAPFTVAAVFDPVAMDDSTVGDWVLVSPGTARDRFGAVRSQLAVATDSPATVAGEVRTRVPGAVVLDQAAWNDLSGTSWARWFRPFTVTGYLIAAAGGIAVMNMLLLSLLQQRRTRATLRTVGRAAAGERLDIAVQATIVGVLAVVIGVAWSPLMIWLLTLSSPVFYGLSVAGGLVAGPLLIGITITVVFVAAALIAPMLVARRLDVPAALVAD